MAGGSKVTRAIALSVLALAALAAYRNSVSVPFVLDDVPSILDNPTLRHLWPLSAPLTPPHGQGLTVEGRPVLNLSLALNYAVSGTRVWSYHAVNLLIHILAGLTLFGIVRRTGRSAFIPTRWSGRGVEQRVGDNALHPCIPAFVIALLWTLHPLQTESVTYISQRAESLMGLFYLLTLYCFIRYAERSESKADPPSPSEGRADPPGPPGSTGGPSRPALPRRVWAALSFTSCLLGMATKEVMVSAPLIVFLYDRTFIAGNFREAWRRRRYYLGLAATWLLLAALVLHAGDRGGTSGPGSGAGFGAYWLTQFPALVRYLRLTFWPHPLIFDYGTQWVGSVPAILPQIFLIAALIAATLFALRRWPAAGFLGVCFFVLLAPTSLVPGNRQTMAEHRMYLPLAAVLTLGVAGIFRLVERGDPTALVRPRSRANAVGSPRSILLALFSACALLLALQTYHRNQIYRTRLALYADTAAKIPSNPFAQANFGLALFSAGHPNEAVPYYQAAVRLRPAYPDARNNLGNALLELRRPAEAAVQYEEAVRLDPKFADAYDGWADALLALGQPDQARIEYEEALRLQPGLVEAHNNFANLLMQAGRFSEAIGHYQTAIALDPGYASAHYNLANALLRLGRRDEAVRHYREALRLQPNFTAARRALQQAAADRD